MAVTAGLMSEADYVFLPESPPPNDWPERLCEKLLQASGIPKIFLSSLINDEALILFAQNHLITYLNNNLLVMACIVLLLSRNDLDE